MGKNILYPPVMQSICLQITGGYRNGIRLQNHGHKEIIDGADADADRYS